MSENMGTPTIYVVTASRGDYSDRTEYVVCWYADEEHAKQEALAMFQRSEEWRGKIDRLSAVSWEEAQAAVGDYYWSPSDETDYAACLLHHGSDPARGVAPKAAP